MYPCVMNCKVIILCDLCLQYATAQCGLVTDNVRYRPPSSNKRHLRDRTFCNHCLQERNVSPNCEIMVPWYQYLQSWRPCTLRSGRQNLVQRLFDIQKISVIQVLLQLQKGSRNFIKILGISADSNETFPFKFCNRDHQRRRDKRNQNVDTWNPQYGFKLTKSRRKMLLLSSQGYQHK